MTEVVSPVEIRLINAGEVQRLILNLSVLHTNAMAESPWCEEWSNDLEGTDPRTNSPAMFRKLLAQSADFFIAEMDKEVIGLGIGMLLTRAYLHSMEWGRSDCYIPRAPEPDDYEMNLVVIHPDYRGNGLMSRLAECRLDLAKRKLKNGKRIWVQTIPPVENHDLTTGRVMSYYEKQGFKRSGQLTIKETERVFWSFQI